MEGDSTSPSFLSRIFLRFYNEEEHGAIGSADTILVAGYGFESHWSSLFS